MNASKEGDKARMYCQAVNQHINDGHARVMNEEVPKQDNAVLLEVWATIKGTLLFNKISDSSGRSQGGCWKNASTNKIKTFRQQQLQIFMERVAGDQSNILRQIVAVLVHG